jgi:hypothetical protein
MKFRTILIFLILSGLSESNAFSWGSEGHDVVVKMALRMMKPSERKAVYDLLGTHDTYVIGNWADSIKKFNGTSKWHYVDIPERDEHYNADRDCQNGDCIIAKLGMVQATIKNHSASKQKRREALLYWFHLVGDLYQPFHCYGDKAGGNEIKVYFKGEETNLHALWDYSIIKYKQPSPTLLAEDIFDAHGRVPATTPTFIEAAEHSHARAIDMKLKNNSDVSGDYAARSWATIQACLWEAACMASTIGADV